MTFKGCAKLHFFLWKMPKVSNALSLLVFGFINFPSNHSVFLVRLLLPNLHIFHLPPWMFNNSSEFNSFPYKPIERTLTDLFHPGSSVTCWNSTMTRKMVRYLRGVYPSTKWLLSRKDIASESSTRVSEAVSVFIELH